MNLHLYKVDDQYHVIIKEDNRRYIGILFKNNETINECKWIMETKLHASVESVLINIQNFISNYFVPPKPQLKINVSERQVKDAQKSENSVWINIDIPQNYCMLHYHKCRHIPWEETVFKGINRILHHGGWFSFKRGEDAKSFHEKNHSALFFLSCNGCVTNLYRTNNLIF